MKARHYYSIFICICILGQSPCFAQLGFESSSRRSLKEADHSFQNRTYFDAAERYKKAMPNLRKKDLRARCIFMLGECYRAIGDFKAAEIWYSKAILARYPDPIAHLYKAQALEKDERYAEAISEYILYKSMMKSNPLTESGIRSCEIASKWKGAPEQYIVENMSQLNSGDYDFSPMYLDRKKNILVFTSRRNGASGRPLQDLKTGLLFSDLFYSQMDKNGRWETPRPMEATINTEANEGSCWVNSKGDKMYFTRCEKNKNQITRCAIWVCTRKGNNSWSRPSPVSFGLDDFEKYNFRHPALSPDESIMVFQSDIESLQADSSLAEPDVDLYISRLDKKTNTWSKPENLGSGINTRGKEGFPCIRQDGTLYYSSDGMMGMGGLDIFRAEKVKDKWEWKMPENLKYPLNSAGDDFGIIFDGTKNKGFFSSNREGGKGKDDIWSFVMPPLIINLDGYVTDCQNKDSLEGAVVRMMGSDGSALECKTLKGGRYSFSLDPNLTYQLNVLAEKARSVSAQAYLNLAGSEKIRINTLGITVSSHFHQDFCLSPAVTETDIPFPHVEYELDRATLTKASLDSLNYLYHLLQDNPNLVIELAAHTDSRGSDEHNLRLSQARAKACYNYLVGEMKLNPQRIIPKGYGKRHLLYSDQQIAAMKTDEEKEMAHQKNRRTVIRILNNRFTDPSTPAADRRIVPQIRHQEDYGTDSGTDAEN